MVFVVCWCLGRASGGEPGVSPGGSPGVPCSPGLGGVLGVGLRGACGGCIGLVWLSWAGLWGLSPIGCIGLADQPYCLEASVQAQPAGRLMKLCSAEHRLIWLTRRSEPADQLGASLYMTSTMLV